MMGSKSKRQPETREEYLLGRDAWRRRRAAFIARYNANPCNFLPGPVLFNLYRTSKSQKVLEAAAATWIEKHNEYHWEPESRYRIAWPR